MSNYLFNETKVFDNQNLLGRMRKLRIVAKMRVLKNIQKTIEIAIILTNIKSAAKETRKPHRIFETKILYTFI